MYKVFVKETPIIFSQSKTSMDNYHAYTAEIDDELRLEILERAEIGDLINVVGPINGNITRLFADYDKIVAAGGVVQNADGATLFIYRNDKWDLPKGKLEKGESVAICAVREVEEECGISGLEILNELPSTWHTYEHKGRNVLKRTYWFSMGLKHQQNDLVPQLEEGITDVRWVSGDLNQQRSNTYNSINDLLDKI